MSKWGLSNRIINNDKSKKNRYLKYQFLIKEEKLIFKEYENQIREYRMVVRENKGTAVGLRKRTIRDFKF